MRRSLPYLVALLLATGCASTNPMRPSGPTDYVGNAKGTPHVQPSVCDLGPGYQNDDVREEDGK
jgi:hypothetical protein